MSGGRRARDVSTVWVVGRGKVAGRGTQGAEQVAGRKTWRKSRDVRYGASRRTRGTDGSRDVRRGVGRGARAYGAVREGESIPSRMDRPPGVSGGKRGRRREKDVRRCRPMLHRRAHSRHGGNSRGGPVHVAQTGPLSIGKGLREEVTIHVAQMGTLPLEGPGEERPGGGERRYPSSLHRRAPSSHQESRERRLSRRKRLRKTGSSSSLNSQKDPIPTQSPHSAARKIPRGRARVC
jgi:hypothetical protein